VELGRSTDPSDGLLDVVSVEAGDRAKLRGLLERCLAGKRAAPLLRIERAERVHLSLGPHELRVDDEVLWPPRNQPKPRDGRRRVSVSIGVAPGALACVLPRG
jgi:hypothetical protein